MKKIFIGLVNIASQIGELSDGFNKLGYKTFSVVLESYSLMETNKFDVNIESQIPVAIKKSSKFNLPGRLLRNIYRNQLKKKYFNEAVKSCDLFIFIWSSFRGNYSDYKKLKKRGKKTITLFVGDDIRYYDAMKQDFEFYGLPPIEYSTNNNLLKNKLSYLRVAEKYSDLIFSAPNQSQLALRPYYKFFVPIDLSVYKENTNQNRVPTIIHAPSFDIFKGTKYVLNAIDKLKNEGLKFEFKLIKNLPHNEAIKVYENSDILIGQMLCPGGGKQEREALACGCLVLSSMRYSYPEKTPDDCPIIDVGPENIFDELKKIILDYPTRVELAKRGRPWVEKHHDTKVVCSRILELLIKNNKPDFYPTFFRNIFLPESKKTVRIYNKSTKYVSDCDWYKNNIKPGARDGLIF